METTMNWLMQFGPAAAIGAGVVILGLRFGPRAFTLVRAVTSGWNKDNVKARLAICKVCPRVKAREYVDPEGALTTFLYCDECKCGSHHIAELNVKLGFNNLSCPMEKWGPKSGMSVHEGHDLLIERARKEREVDQRERENIMAGRDRDDNGPLGNNGPGMGQPSNRTPTAQAQLQPTSAAANAQRERINKAKEEARARIQPDASQAPENASAHAAQTNKIWGDRDKGAASATAATTEEETTNTAPLAGKDHEGQILVDQKE